MKRLPFYHGRVTLRQPYHDLHPNPVPALDPCRRYRWVKPASLVLSLPNGGNHEK